MVLSHKHNAEYGLFVIACACGISGVGRRVVPIFFRRLEAPQGLQKFVERASLHCITVTIFPIMHNSFCGMCF